MIRYREASTPDGTFGIWPEDDGSETYQTLEPGDDTMFTAGTFTMRARFSPKHQELVFGYLNVPGHDNEEIHSLNVWKLANGTEQSEGCTGLGDKRGPVNIDGVDYPHAILNSRATLDRFMARRGCPEYKTLNTQALCDAWIAAHPDLAEFSLTVVPAP
jgi:hypothetical protein